MDLVSSRAQHVPLVGAVLENQFDWSTAATVGQTFAQVGLLGGDVRATQPGALTPAVARGGKKTRKPGAAPC